MLNRTSVRLGGALVLTLALMAGGAYGQSKSTKTSQKAIPGATASDHPLQLAYNAQDKAPPAKTAPPPARTERTVAEHTTVRTETHSTDDYGYKEISDFFNIREANSSVKCGEWELEIEGGWSTSSDGSDDDGFVGGTLKYGLSDDTFLELEALPINLGDGGDQGAGDISLLLFHQWTHEPDHWAAFATWGEVRIPTGDGSEGVDGTLHFTLTKTLAPCWRMHWDGYVETANGDIGDDDSDRRNFQWGLGPGIDYTFDNLTIGTINYLHQSSEEYGQANRQTIELGVSRELCPNQHLKAAIDINVDGHSYNDNVGAKLLWSIEF